MAMKTLDDFDGPIPGENFTSDTKNYPWHRPPKFTDIDEAIEYTAKHLSDPDNAITLLTMIKAGMPINVLSRTYVMSNVGNGNWSVDYAILLAGPTAKIMMMMADGANIKYTTGLDKMAPPTLPFLEFTGTVDEGDVQNAIENVDTDQVESQAQEQAPVSGAGGFMAPRANTADDTDQEGNL